MLWSWFNTSFQSDFLEPATCNKFLIVLFRELLRFPRQINQRGRGASCAVSISFHFIYPRVSMACIHYMTWESCVTWTRIWFPDLLSHINGMNTSWPMLLVLKHFFTAATAFVLRDDEEKKWDREFSWKLLVPGDIEVGYRYTALNIIDYYDNRVARCCRMLYRRMLLLPNWLQHHLSYAAEHSKVEHC